MCDLRSEEHTSELQSHLNLVCRLLLEKKTKHSSYSLSVSVSGPTAQHVLTTRCALALHITPLYGLCCCASASRPWRFFFFFLMNPRPPNSTPFPLPAAFPF